ncbi:single-stranded DNA-binding protein [Agromyces archimandritae]|uniref:Single-stranded DNA-binding protein n=1 Tax=Agromyces archimandritae TaxID=2781962 RepID=A0A975FLX7_9MICO|nr:single-stranded DNA-binding protein [Agromyces archimandritae]QTX04539.1 single-stranded DNA-binding protein [Agromyces archimandritae]
MADHITITGFVGNEPQVIPTKNGQAMTVFRIGSTRRRRTENGWEDAGTNWYGVTAHRYLGQNAHASIKKGDPVVVSGQLRVTDWENGERRGTNLDIVADAIGHDLGWGRSVFARSITRSTSPDAGADEAWPETGPASADGDPGDAAEDPAGDLPTEPADATPVPF